VPQKPIEGTSFAETFNDTQAKARHRTKYFLKYFELGQIGASTWRLDGVSTFLPPCSRFAPVSIWTNKSGSSMAG
jgi:hypothetical protein